MLSLVKLEDLYLNTLGATAIGSSVAQSPPSICNPWFESHTQRLCVFNLKFMLYLLLDCEKKN